MTRRLLSTALAAASLVLAPLPGLMAPAHAQLTVFDPGNYSQNLLSAARALQQINNQIAGLQNQAAMLQNMTRQATSLDYTALAPMKAALAQIDTLMGQAQSMAFTLTSTEAALKELYPTSLDPNAVTSQVLERARVQSRAAMDGYRQTLKVQAQVVENIQGDAGLIDELIARSQGAVGGLQAQQAANQLQGLAIKQDQQIQTLMAAQFRAEALEAARQRKSRRRANWRRAGSSVRPPPTPPNSRPSAAQRKVTLVDPAPDLNIIDRLMAGYAAMIDSGFGLLKPEVGHLSTIFIALDVTLAALWWTLEGEDSVMARFVKKVLYVGAFAFILNNFKILSETIFRSFAQMGITAGGGGVGADDLLRPGRLAGIGFTAAHPLIDKASQLVGFPEILTNAVTVVVLLLSWVLVVLAFFIMSIQMLVTVLEFKLTSLAGFGLIPFAFWNKSSFLAERVLGNVISSGVKVMVLALIVGIGANFYDGFVATLGPDPDLSAAVTLVLGALTLVALAIFGPAIASGLVTGAPQLGAGAAVGTAAGAAMLLGGGAMLGARALGAAGAGGLAAVRAGTSMGSAASAAYQLRQATSGAKGAAGVASGLGGVGRAVGGAAINSVRDIAGRAASSLQGSARQGRASAWRATGGTSPVDGGASPAAAAATTGSAQGASPPAWARRLQDQQASRMHQHAAVQALKDGDRPGGSANPDLSSKED